MLAALRKYKWLTAVVSIPFATLPVLWFTSWLQSQGEAEVLVEANSSIKILELIIDQTVSTLNELDARGIRSCEASDLQILRRASFASDSIRELAVVDPNGGTLCTDRSTSVVRDVIATESTSIPEIVLDVIRTADSNERLLQVRRLATSQTSGLAALLRVNQFLPRIAPDGAPFTGHARLALADGTVIGTSGNKLLDSQDVEPIVGRAASKRYGPVVTVMMLRRGLIANHDDLRRIQSVFGGMTAIVILICAILIPRWSSNDPIMLIEDALISGQFMPYYQPIIDINSGNVLGAEILARWRKSDGSMVEPEAFIAFIESSNLVRDFTRFLIRKACAEVGAVLGKRPQMYLAINIAPRHLIDPGIINDIGSAVDASPIRLSQVVLELTERCDLEDREAAHRVISALHGLGLRIALDDFGAGRNGLSYVNKLGVDIIKIDKSFVETITTAHKSQAIAETVTRLAGQLHLQVIAEGVESFEQVAFLRKHGINAAQGYVFAPPLPASAFVSLIEALDPQPSTGSFGDEDRFATHVASPSAL